MSAYWKVMIHGTNFQYRLDGQASSVGFYVTAFVESDSRQSAEKMAIDDIRDRLTLGGRIIVEGHVVAEQIERVSRSSVPPRPLGFAWYREDD
jgi:hypothetical protein